ncbi:2-phospho-L-lactate transferase CofD family protein [Flavobacteriales bacterium]|nr:2-phospho-L-lactate transferase CofD family protein [Flavobacteriales bacterium]
MKISIFSGGRGNKNLFQAFAKQQCEHELNVIVNGLDDGASTGDIRRLMDYKIHGISDFLKTITAFSNDPFIDVMKVRFPKNSNFLEKIKMISNIYQFLEQNITPKFLTNLKTKTTESQLEFIKENLLTFIENVYKFREEIVDLSDYKIGNIIFASLLINNNLDFKASIKKFCKICNIQSNVNILEATKLPLNLVGILKNGTLLPNEASVVLSRTTDLIQRTYQINNPLSLNQIRKISSLEKNDKIQYLNTLETTTDSNIEVLNSLESSDLIIYGSGTPYSSILPSLEYLGVADKIASNNCSKILIANLQKETDNFLGTSSLIEDIIKFLTKSSTLKHDPKDFITHILVSNNNEIENKIVFDIQELKIKFPWITIIEDDFNDPNIKGTHNGSKVLDSILNI